LVNELVEAKHQLQLRRVLARWARYDLFTLDEVGYVPMVREGRLDEVRAQDEKYGPPRDRPSASQNVLRQRFASFPPGFSRRT
jgi:hypothetical protein